MSSIFTPEVVKPEEVEVEDKKIVDTTGARGRTGMTILAGLNSRKAKTTNKAVLGG